jgi:predicted GIY-YIG superfamily endonuclease
MAEEYCALYRFYDETGALLYVGISSDPGRRFAQHRSDKPWWHAITEIRVQPMPSRKAALKAEREAIKNERPRFNVAHNEILRALPKQTSTLEVLVERASDLLALKSRYQAGWEDSARDFQVDFAAELGVEIDRKAALMLACVSDVSGREVPALYAGLIALMCSFSQHDIRWAIEESASWYEEREIKPEFEDLLEHAAGHLAHLRSRELYRQGVVVPAVATVTDWVRKAAA